MPTRKMKNDRTGPALVVRAQASDARTPASLSLEATATITVEAKGADGEGAAPLPRFEMIANTGAVPMRLEGWKYPVVLDFEGLTIPSQQRPIRLGHDSTRGVGHTDSIGFTAGQLVARGVISRDTPDARDVVSSSRNGFPWQASVGTSVDEVEFIRANDGIVVNGNAFKGPLNVIRKATLGEISFVDLGADGNTIARVAAQEKTEKDGGETDPPKRHDEAGVGESIARAKAERDRQIAIKAAVEEELSLPGADVAKIEEVADLAIEAGWTVQLTQLELMRANRARAPRPRKLDVPTPSILTASLCLACGIKDEVLAKDRDFGPEVTNKAWHIRGYGLHGILAAALEAAGIRPPHGGLNLYRAVVENQRVQAAGFSTINLPGILGNVANKILLDAFTSIEATYPLIADQADFANFYTHSIYRLDALGEFEEVAPNGELKHGNLGESSYSNKVNTSGQILVLDRQHIVNDDLNAFRSLPAQLARKARLAVEKALYNALCESVDSFYTTGQNNKLTGSLGLTELSAAEAAMMSMADSGGDPIYAMPRYLVVPPALKALALSIYQSELLQGATSSARGQPATNIFRGRFQVVSSPFLSAASIVGSSATTWYLLADPAMLPAFQVAYLNGQRAPMIETADAEFNTLGMQMRCIFDFGVAQIDYRGAVKNVAA